MATPESSKPPSRPSSRSSSRKRSSTNLANLRLAPLSTRFAEPAPSSSQNTRRPRSPLDSPEFTRQHSTYLAGKSAPSTPGILSRSSSRTHFSGGGLSRRGELYDEKESEVTEPGEYFGHSTYERAEIGSGRISKARSEATLSMKKSKQGGRSSSRQGYARSSTSNAPSGTTTPRASRTKHSSVDEDWLTRTRVATGALLAESKGHSWYASRSAQVNVAPMDSTDDDDDDDNYEEMAAQAAREAQATGSLSPTSVRAPKERPWGSRYGSRSVSRRTSRRGSVTTPRPTMESQDLLSYFDSQFPDQLAEGESSADDEPEISQYPLGGITGFVDRLMSFGLFNAADDRDDTTDHSEAERRAETSEQAKARMDRELRRKREEKERLVAVKDDVVATTTPTAGSASDEGGWADVSYLLSVAAKAMF
nr:hypothetical protein CFP56_67034 [Quercus suber]